MLVFFIKFIKIYNVLIVVRRIKYMLVIHTKIIF